MNTLSPRFLALLTLLALPATVVAATYTDPFTDGTLVGGSDNSGLSWYRRSANQAIAIANDTGIGSGNALQLTISANQIDRAVIGVFSNFTLVNVGDQISLAFDFRFTATPTVNTADGLRFGLYNSNGTSLTGSGTTESDDDFGYQASIGTGTSTGFSLFEELNSGAGGLGSNNPNTDRNALSSSTATAGGIGDTVKHSLLYTITKTAAGVSFSASLDGISLGTGVDTTSPYLTFNEVVINHGTPQGYALDNVTVTTTTVPEPTTAALLGLGVAGLFARRRR